MKKLLIATGSAAAIALAVIALASPSTVRAAPINDCGHLPYLIIGYQEIANVTSRVVPCSRAREIAWQIEQQILYRGHGSQYEKVHLREHWFHWNEWTVHTHWYRVSGPLSYISQDVRATASRGRVVHYQLGGE